MVDLSKLLNSLPIHANRAENATFRNSHGVYMKLCNYLRHDDRYPGEGLASGSQLDKAVWEEFYEDRKRLRNIADAIRDGATELQKKTTQVADVDDEEEFPEGRILMRLHRERERNPGLVKKAKQAALKKHGRLFCKACNFDFHEQYGDVGEGFIECHHVLPLSVAQQSKPKLVDIALLCSNCHRMVHRRRPWLEMDQLTSYWPKNFANKHQPNSRFIWLRRRIRVCTASVETQAKIRRGRLPRLVSGETRSVSGSATGSLLRLR